MIANLASAKIFHIPSGTPVLSFAVLGYPHTSLDSVQSNQILAFLYDLGHRLQVLSLLTKFKQKNVVIFPMTT